MNNRLQEYVSKEKCDDQKSKGIDIDQIAVTFALNDFWFFSHFCIFFCIVLDSFICTIYICIAIENISDKRQMTTTIELCDVRCVALLCNRLEFVFSELNFPHQRACGYEYAQCCQGERKRKWVWSMLSLRKINHSSKILNEMKWHQYHWNGVIPSNCVTWFTCLLSLVHVFII